MEQSILLWLAIVACGVVIGILSSMFGIGGGTIMVPLIHVALGQPAAAASGTSLFCILPTSISGMVARLHDGTVNFKMGLAIGVVGALFSPLGAVAATYLPGVYAILLTSVCILFSAYKQFSRVWKTRASATGGSAGAEGDAMLAHVAGAQFFVCAGTLGALVGFLSGYLGLGGGFLVVPLLQVLFGFTTKQATGTSLVAVACFAVPSFVTHAILGNIRWAIGLLLIAGSLVGTRIGAVLIKRLDDRLLTLLFGIFLVCVGLFMAFQEIAG